MKKYLYILRNKNSSLLIYEDDKLKYFEGDSGNHLEKIEKYLKDKMDYNFLKVVMEKDVVYYDQEYSVVLVDIFELKEIKDMISIKLLNRIKSEDIDYKDLKLLEIFCSCECRLFDLNQVELNKKEKEVTLKNIITATIIALSIITFFIGRESVNYFGISVPIVVILTSSLAIFSIGKVKNINYTGVYFLIVAILLSTTYGIFTNNIFRAVNIILIPIALITGLYMISFSDTKLNSVELLKNIIPNITIGIFSNSHIEMIRKVLTLKGKERLNLKNSKYKGIVTGVIISIPLLIILTILLSSADEIFASIFGNIINNMTNTIFLLSAKGLIAKLVTFTIVFIYIYYLFSSFKFIVKTAYVKNIKKLDKNMVNTILVLINILYLIFTYIQIKYLYIKYNFNLTPEEYSNYARNGFFQLIAVVILNIIIIIYFKNKIDNSKLTYALNTLMTVISINMGLSSLYKMSLYIKEFGMTQLRFMTSIFMVFTLIMLVIIAISLWKNIDLFKYCIIVGSIIYLVINFCNMDKIIAQYNLDAKGEGVDIQYLSTLSLDSYDVVLKAYKEGNLDEAQFIEYKNQKKFTSKWYEYNYYNNK